jgi:hypothetical protein
VRAGGIISRLLSKLTDQPIRDDPASFGDVPFVPVEMRVTVRKAWGGEAASNGDPLGIKAMSLTHCETGFSA